jgi:CheY-like chemotaxis protein
LRRLLIVDDDAALRRLFRLNLSESYEIIDTGDPEQALALALEHKPDAILMDLRMPKFSGHELCRSFTSLSKTQPIPIYLVSGEILQNPDELCKELGAAGYFQKPIDFDALEKCLADLKRQKVVARSEVRVQLRVPLKLQGLDTGGKAFNEATSTEDVSLSGFQCPCNVSLRQDAILSVYLVSGGDELVGTARVARVGKSSGAATRYGFRFVEKTGPWVLQ